MWCWALFADRVLVPYFCSNELQCEGNYYSPFWSCPDFTEFFLITLIHSSAEPYGRNVCFPCHNNGKYSQYTNYCFHKNRLYGCAFESLSAFLSYLCLHKWVSLLWWKIQFLSDILISLCQLSLTSYSVGSYFPANTS